MAIIGTFTSTGNGFTGTVRTLALNAKAEKPGSGRYPVRKGTALPHLRRKCRTGRGLAEDRKGHRARLPLGQAGRSELPAPIYATLIEVEGQDGLQLIWSRPNRD